MLLKSEGQHVYVAVAAGENINDAIEELLEVGGFRRLGQALQFAQGSPLRPPGRVFKLKITAEVLQVLTPDGRPDSVYVEGT